MSCSRHEVKRHLAACGIVVALVAAPARADERWALNGLFDGALWDTDEESQLLSRNEGEAGAEAHLRMWFAADLGLTFPILHSPPESADDIQRLYQTTGVPESFLIGRDGVIYRRISGATSWDSPQYREQILRLLGE